MLIKRFKTFLKEISEEIRFDNLLALNLFPQEYLIYYSDRTLRYGRTLTAFCWGYFAVLWLGLGIRDLSISNFAFQNIDESKLGILFFIVLFYYLLKFISLSNLDVSFMFFKEHNDKLTELFVQSEDEDVEQKNFTTEEEKHQFLIDQIKIPLRRYKDADLWRKRTAWVSVVDFVLPVSSATVALFILSMQIIIATRWEIILSTVQIVNVFFPEY